MLSSYIYVNTQPLILCALVWLKTLQIWMLHQYFCYHSAHAFLPRNPTNTVLCKSACNLQRSLPSASASFSVFNLCCLLYSIWRPMSNIFLEFDMTNFCLLVLFIWPWGNENIMFRLWWAVTWWDSLHTQDTYHRSQAWLEVLIAN